MYDIKQIKSFMKKYFLIVGSLSGCCLYSFCQQTEEHRTDSLKIDSLKMVLPLLKDSARVDCLNNISGKYRDFDMNTRQARHDSISKYAFRAYTEGTVLGYQKGILESLLRLGSSELYLARKYPTAEKYLRQAVELSGKVANAKLSGDAYSLFADLLGKKNDSEDKAVIENDKKAIYYYHQAGAREQEAEWTTWLSWCFIGLGKFEEGFPYCVKSIELTKSNAQTAWGHTMVEYALEGMSNLYNIAGDYVNALDYLRQARAYGLAHNTDYDESVELGTLFRQMGQLDSSFHYLQKAADESPDNPFTRMFLGETYLSAGEYDKALKIFLGSVDVIRNFKGFDDHLLAECLLNIGNCYAGKKKYALALKYAKEGSDRSVKYGNRLYDERSFTVEGYQLLSEIYYHLGKTKLAYDYLKRYSTIKDSTQNKQYLWRLSNQLNNYKKEAEDEKKRSEIRLLNKDNELKDGQLKQQAAFRKFFVAVFVALVVAGIFIFRSLSLKRKTEKLQREQLESKLRVQQLENEKKQAELQQQAAELEMQALRAQMNPHFIFNCLSSINRFILKNESKIASNYLTRFSRLMRMVLMNSQKPLITLENELDMLGIYLEMERLRFKNSFDYGITFLNAIDTDNVFIPPLLLQPFCENAIWHGLMHLPAGRDGKDDHGRLDIVLTMQDNVLNCIITDNGIGREIAGEMKSKTAEKEKSMGLKITTERLALLNREKGLHTFYEIEDLKDENGEAAGTKVILNISFKDSVEASV